MSRICVTAHVVDDLCGDTERGWAAALRCTRLPPRRSTTGDVSFAPPADICHRLREHTRTWPMTTAQEASSAPRTTHGATC
jgi:hypothetical protein